jgi:hypothetical protein
VSHKESVPKKGAQIFSFDCSALKKKGLVGTHRA